MRICFAFLSFGKNIFGGIENSIYNLALGFRECGAEVHVYSSFLSGKEDQIDGFPVFRSNELPRELPVGNEEKDRAIEAHLTTHHERIRSEFHEYLRDRRSDVVITFDPLWGIVQFSNCWQESPCPIVMSFHVVNGEYQLEMANRIPFQFRRSVSPLLKKQIEEASSLTDLVVIPNSLDTRLFSPDRNIGFESKVIFCNARLNPDKGTTHLLKAFASFLLDYPDHELWLCGGMSPFGDGERGRAEVDDVIASFDLASKVRIFPALEWAQIPNLIRQAFVVVLPTYYESFGRAAIESLACGIPVVASRVGNIPNLVGDAAVLVQPRSAEEIYKGLIRLRRDRQLYETMSKLGPEIAAAYDNRGVANIWMEMIEAAT